jgi:carbon storage regulator CsrA
MLVVTRKAGEKVVIPQVDIEIVVAAVLPNGRVRLGIKAPPKVLVFREELLAERTEKQ